MFSEVKNKVLNLAGRMVSNAAPAAGQMLRWDGTSSQWKPMDPTVSSAEVLDFQDATAAIADARIAVQKGEASGLASLGSDGKLTRSQLPELSLTDVHVVNSLAEMLALATTTQSGDVALRTDVSKTYIHNGGNTGTITDWTELLVPPQSVLSVNGKTGVLVLSTDDVAEGVANQYFTTARVQATNVGGDSTGTVSNQKTVKLQGVAISAATPSDKAVLRFSSESGQYELVTLDTSSVAGLEAALTSKASQASLDITNAAVALKASSATVATLQTLVDTKAPQSAVDTLNTEVAAINTAIGDLTNGEVSAIAGRVTALETAPAKALQSEFSVAQGNITDLTANKADKTQVTSDIAAAVAPLATTSAMNTALAAKATIVSMNAADSALDSRLTTAESDIDAIQAKDVVQDSNISTLQSVKADKSYVDGKDVALGARIDAIVGTGGEGLSLDSLDTRVVTLEANDVTTDAAIAALQSGKVGLTAYNSREDAQDLTISGKAEQTALNSTNTNVSGLTTRMTAAEGSITTLQADSATKVYVNAQNAAQDTVIATKADDALTTAALDTKASISYTNTQLSLKADESTVNSALNLKADKTTVATDIATAIAPLATKAYVDGADNAMGTRMTTAESAISGVQTKNTEQDGRLTTLESGKADKTYVDGQDTAIAATVTAVAGRATALESRASSLETNVAALATSDGLKATQADFSAYQTTQAAKDAAQDATCATKAIAADVTAALALKTNQTDFVTLQTTVSTMSSSLSVDARFALVPKFTKVTLNYTDAAFQAASGRIEIPVLALPARSKIVGLTVKPAASFAGPGFGSISASVGPQIGGSVVSADEAFYADSMDLMAAVSDDNFLDSLEYLSKTFAAHNAAVVVKADHNFGSGGATVLTSGQLEVIIGYIVLP
jgi:hypothetical protein